MGYLMRYAELRRHVWILWREARFLDPVDPQYRRWIAARTLGRVFDAATVCDNAANELCKHLAHDYRLDGTELLRFTFWWNHAMEKGFNGENPLKHLHKPGKVKA